jgi:heptosyltransferase III
MKRGSSLNRFLDYYLGVPLLCLLSAFHKRSFYREPPGQIGILFNPALGDTLLASASVQEVRNLYPGARLVAFVTPANVAAARLIPGLDAIEMLPIMRPFRAIQVIRKCRLDLLLDLTAWQRITAIYTLLSGAAFTIGYERARQHRHSGYDKTVPHLGDCHEIENLRRFTRCLGSQFAPAPRLSIPPGPIPEVLAHCDRVVVFHAWASGTRAWLREWPEASWIELAQRLKTPGRVFLLTGSPADELRCDSFLRSLHDHGIPARILIGRHGIDEVARVLAHAELLVSVNTGIMHLGAILGVPTIALNGPTAVRRWGALGPCVANLSPPDGSGGFLDLGFEYPRRATGVMHNITPAEVADAAHRLLGGSHLGNSLLSSLPSYIGDLRTYHESCSVQTAPRAQARDTAAGVP